MMDAGIWAAIALAIAYWKDMGCTRWCRCEYCSYRRERRLGGRAPEGDATR
jgi:hypothetical protein